MANAFRSIPELLADVPVGTSKNFPAVVSETSQTPFVDVHYNHDYGTSIEWKNRPAFQELPWSGSREKPRIGVWDVVEPDLAFSRKADKLVDFYSTGTGAFILSDSLASLIETLDPNSVESRPVSVRARDRNVTYRFCMPVRSLSVIDTSRTTVRITDERFGSEWLRSVKFDQPVCFDESALGGIHSFSDVDLANRWIWSQVLVNSAKIANMRGLYTSKPGSVAGEIDRL